ncbi:hypothetical protein I7I53_08826 [Histoplasma capsulatum var. duboisii H88]|uniref:Uncharacterized protein n=1 Tax=Ajellomyces capsulatus (strain H88) TaxID=544711 RepID=A0A8A1L9K5_AJEC8|nr:hypothetical protein I7I53_08826 [Histoplasma capsulatum var. duboisii H88]
MRVYQYIYRATTAHTRRLCCIAVHFFFFFIPVTGSCFFSYFLFIFSSLVFI